MDKTKAALAITTLGIGLAGCGALDALLKLSDLLLLGVTPAESFSDASSADAGKATIAVGAEDKGGIPIIPPLGFLEVEDEDGNPPIKQWFETLGINCLLCSDADSSSSLSDYQDLIDYYTAANASGDLILVRRSFDMNGTSFSNHPTTDTWMDDMAAFAATNSAAYTTARGWGGSYLGQVRLGERFDAYHYTARGVANLAGQWLEGTTTGLTSLQLTPTGSGNAAMAYYHYKRRRRLREEQSDE